MAGSYSHVTDSEGKFMGVDLLDHMGDAYEALKEMHWMISHLARQNKTKIFEAHRSYVAAPTGCNNPDYAKTMTEKDFWAAADGDLI